MSNTTKLKQEQIGLSDLAFPEKADIEVFEIWLDKHDHIKPNFLNRNDLNNESFILEGPDLNGYYELKIALDIKNSELYNLSKFLEEKLGLEYFGSISRFQDKIRILVGALIKSETLSLEEVKEILKHNNIEVDESIFNEDIHISGAELFEAVRQIKVLSTEASEGNLGEYKNKKLKSISKTDAKSIASKMLQQLLFTQIHNRGVDELGSMKTITKGEVEKLYEKHGINDGNIDLKKYRNFINSGFNDFFSNLDEAEQDLSDKIGIYRLKKDLEAIRKTGTQEEINALEIEATNDITKILYQYPWSFINKYGSFPKYSKEYKEVLCLGFSFLGHRFLQELGIKHKGLDMPLHSALELDIGSKKYYLDIAYSNNMYEFDYGDFIKHEDINGNVIKGVYREVKLRNAFFDEKMYAYSGNPENILQSQLYSNLYDYNNRIKSLETSIELNPKNSSAYNNLGGWLYNEGDYNGAINMYKKAIKLNPKDSGFYSNLGLAFHKVGDYNLAVNMLRMAIKLDIMNIDAHNNLRLILDDMYSK